MSLEVKSTLRKGGPLKDAKIQVDGCKEMINAWFGADLKAVNDWQFIGVMYFEKVKDAYRPQFCEHCRQYVILGQERQGFEGSFETRFGNIVRQSQARTWEDGRGEYFGKILGILE